MSAPPELIIFDNCFKLSYCCFSVIPDWGSPLFDIYCADMLFYISNFNFNNNLFN